ncbi:hypothetical protein LCGC14_0966310 [marine sediment metagenome]|uniref:Radical SAM core domain-containing protein n=1 Tax=marine sediment metagenome TaxID=412755 RepID=A0A0F9NHE9_9ZZZZ
MRDRKIKHIRFSVTSKCNFKCIFCDSEGFIPKTSELTLKEITKLCKILAEVLKVTRIKFTGGEPLCREEIVEIIRNVSELRLYKDISMTTNGFFLYEKAEELHNAGLNRINVSLASLKQETFKFIYGSDSLDKVLRGLHKAKEVGLNPIKLNFVLQLIELHKASDVLGGNGNFFDKYHVDIKPIIDRIELKAVETKIRGSMQNRKVFVLPNSATIETITPGHDFCLGCTKLRVGCDGTLFGCLNRSDLGTNIKAELNNHYPLAKYEEIVRQVVDSREPYF